MVHCSLGRIEELKHPKKAIEQAGGKTLLQEELRTRPRLKRTPEDKLTVLKLGGSVITKKDKPMTANPNAIERLAKEIAEADVDSLIIVHGGGSFGHPLAKEYSIKEGYKDPSQVEGFSKTHQAMLELNNLVIEALIHHNIAAFSVSPSSCIVTKAGRIQIFYDSSITKLLDIGVVPVLFGDAVLDNSLGFTILSGDQLVAALATNLGADRIILGVDVDGLHTADPKSVSSAQLISHVTLQELKALLHIIGETKAVDVTGGMLGKVSELMPAVEAGVRAYVVNAANEGNIYKVLRGEKVVGTLIEKE